MGNGTRPADCHHLDNAHAYSIRYSPRSHPGSIGRWWGRQCERHCNSSEQCVASEPGVNLCPGNVSRLRSAIMSTEDNMPSFARDIKPMFSEGDRYAMY